VAGFAIRSSGTTPSCLQFLEDEATKNIPDLSLPLDANVFGFSHNTKTVSPKTELAGTLIKNSETTRGRFRY
jgi:hypothetical protein